MAHAEITLKVEKLINNFNGELIFCEIPLIVESGMTELSALFVKLSAKIFLTFSSSSFKFPLFSITTFAISISCSSVFSDKINKSLLCDANYIAKLAKIFPKAVKDGTVNKSLIRRQILHNNAKRLALNELSHNNQSKVHHELAKQVLL